MHAHQYKRGNLYRWYARMLDGQVHVIEASSRTAAKERARRLFSLDKVVAILPAPSPWRELRPLANHLAENVLMAN